MAKKQDLPAMPFYVGDWLKCPEVKVLPPDIRGLWFDMICYMWESVERGVMVKPNHHPYAKEEIIRMIGVDCSGTGSWLDILIDNGVCSVRPDGAIFSRRMIKDESIRQVRSSAGQKSAAVKAGKLPKKQDSIAPEPPGDNPPPTPPPLSPEEQAKADKAKKYKYADFVTLTRDEYAKLCEEYSEDGAKAMIEILNNYKGSKGKKYKSDYLTIRGWVKDKYYEDLQKNGTSKAKPNIPTPESGVQRDYEESFR